MRILTRLTVLSRVVRDNAADLECAPPLEVEIDGRPRERAHIAVVRGKQGEEVARIVYDPDRGDVVIETPLRVERLQARRL